MKTDVIRVNSNGEGAADALDETAKFAAHARLGKRDALWLRLLSEETLGMVNVITGDFEADFWMESEKDRICRIYLVAKTKMDYAKKQELIEASSDKKNAASKGFMGKIRELMEKGRHSVDEMGHLSMEYGHSSVMYGTMGMCDMETAAMNSYIYEWSLEKYRREIEEAGASQEGATEAWDELEKSIVARIADEVRVGVKGDTVELVIEKRLV